MQVVISPYHLTTREPPAMAALVLASRAFTLMPAPPSGAGRTQVRAAAERVPAYLRFMESWRWTMPLWHAGVLGSGAAGEEIADDVRAACECIAREERLAPLRAFVRDDALADPERYLHAIAADVLKAGPDPSVSVPVAAGLDRFASRHGMIVARAAAASLVQREEERLGERLAALAIPVIVQADGRVLVEAALRLRETLAPLRAALSEAAASGPGAGGAMESLRYAAREYESEFTDRRAELAGLGGEEEVAVRVGHVTVLLMRLPADAALDASLAASRAARGETPRPAAINGRAGAARTQTMPALVRASCSGPVSVMIVRTLGRTHDGPTAGAALT